MITKSIITFHLSPPKVTTPLILVLISPTHNYVCLLYLYVSLNNIDLSFAGFKILCRWYFTMYVFCFSLFFCCCSALCFCDLSKLVYVSQLIRFCHSINNPNLIIHSPIEGHLGDFSITNRAAMNILGYISLCLRINLGVHLQLYQILPICSPKLAKLC